MMPPEVALTPDVRERRQIGGLGRPLMTSARLEVNVGRGCSQDSLSPARMTRRRCGSRATKIVRSHGTAHPDSDSVGCRRSIGVEVDVGAHSC